MNVTSEHKKRKYQIECIPRRVKVRKGESNEIRLLLDQQQKEKEKEKETRQPRDLKRTNDDVQV